LAVARLDRDERQKSAADAAGGFAGDFHMCRAYALDQSNHRSDILSIRPSLRRPQPKKCCGSTSFIARICSIRTAGTIARFQPDKDSVRWYIAVLYFFLRLIGRLPLRWLHALGAGVGWLLWTTPNPLRRKATQTLSFVITDFDAKTR